MKTNMGKRLPVFYKTRNLVMATVLAMTSSTSYALDFETYYKVDADFGYQNNPAFAKTDKSSVFSTRIAPSVQFSYADDYNQYNVDVGVSIYENSNEDVLVDYIAPNIAADWSRELEFMRIGIEATYNHVAARAQSLLADGNNQTVDNIARTGTIKGSIDVDFNAKWSLDNQAQYQRVTYTADVANLGDFDLYGGESQLNYKNSDQFTTYTAADYYEYEIQSGNAKDSDIYSLVVGTIYTPAENITVDLSLGGYDVSGVFDDSGVRYAVDAEYALDRVTFYGEMYRKMIAAGLGIFQLNQHFNVGANYQLSEVSSVSGLLAHNKARGEAAVGSQDVTFQSIGFSYDRNYEKWRASLYADFSSLDVDGGSGRTNNRAVGVRVSWDPFDSGAERRNPLDF